MPVESRLAVVVRTSWGRAFAPLATVACVALAAAACDRQQPMRALWAGLVATAAVVWAMRFARGLARTVGWGLAIAVASLGAPAGVSPWLDVCGAAGGLACAIGACLAIARLPAGDGLVASEPRAARLSARPWIAAIAVAWWAAIVASVVSERRSDFWLVDALLAYPRAWTWVAIVVSLGAIVSMIERTIRRRSLELGIAERMRATRALVATVVAGSSSVALFDGGRPDGVARLTLALAGCVAAAAALQPDVVALVRATRRIVGLAVVGGSLALVGTAAVQGRAAGAWVVTLVTAVACLGSGSASALVAASLRPSGGAWLNASDRACENALSADPREAVGRALFALREPLGVAGPSPELWAFAPPCVTSVDAAGYARDRDAELPSAVSSTALLEPYAALRADVLDALEVRRPELRPLASWMRDQGAMLAILVACDGEAEGVLVLPRGNRREPLTLEEIVALRRVADRMAAACRARGIELRVLARAQASARCAEAAEDRVQRLEHERALDEDRNVLATRRLARPATVGIYAAASRMALEALERRTRVGAPIAVVAPAGVDPVPYLARAHLAGLRARGPFVLVDATSAREHDLSRWTDPSQSPLALSDRGMLVLLDAGALPLDVQRLIARACAEGRAPWERPDRLDVQIAVTSLCDPRDLASSGRLDPALESRLDDAVAAPVALPRLQDRPDDFRAILTDRLAREGLRARGRPVGIEPAAYAMLAEYPFPGDDAELCAAVQRLVADCRTDTVRVADVGALGLTARGPSTDSFAASGRKDPLSA